MVIHLDIGHAYKVQHGQSPLADIIMHEEVLRQCDTQVIANSKLTGIAYPVGRDMISAIEIAKEMAVEIKKIYDTEPSNISLWCRGSSGAIMAALVSSSLDLEDHTVDIQHVKKEGENSHSCNEEAYYVEHLHFIVDDFISSGNTIRHIIVGMCKASGRITWKRELDDVYVSAILVAGKYDSCHRIVPVVNDISSRMVNAPWQIADCSIIVDNIICEGYTT